MNFMGLMINGSPFSANHKFLSDNIDSGTNPKNSPKDSLLAPQYQDLWNSIEEFNMSLKAQPIQAVLPQMNKHWFDTIASDCSSQRVPIFTVDKRLIPTPESQWVKTGLGLGPVERAYNDAIARFEEIIKSHGLTLVGHNTAESWGHGYTYSYVVK